MDEELMTSAEVAQMLRVHPKHLYRLLRQGLPGHRVGRGHWRFQRSEVLRWFAARRGRDRSATHDADDRLVPTLVSSSMPPRPGTSRVLLGRVGERWVAHGMSPTTSRRADALVEVEAPAGPLPMTVRAQLLTPHETAAHNILVAGCAPMLGLVLDRLDDAIGAGRHHWISSNSAEALDMLAAGSVHVAGVHLEDTQSGTDHASIVRARFGDEPVSVVRLVRWRIGLALRADETRRADELGTRLDADTRWVQREPGAGTQRVLERVLGRLGTDTTSLRTTHRERDHQGVARAVALGVADAGVVVESIALDHGLRFVPLAEEGFDLVVPSRTEQSVRLQRMIEALGDGDLRREVASTGPYDTSAMGHASTP